MRYQKSMMKILEYALLNRENDKIIEEFIRNTGSGRSSTFNALKWLEDNGFITTIVVGRQKIVKPVIDNYILQYKYYLDALRLKTLPSFVKLIVMALASQLGKIKNVKSAVLFGSSLNSNRFNDIDILILGSSIDNPALNLLREKLESSFSVVINLHYQEYKLNNIFRGVVIYQSSYFELNGLHNQYFEFIEWLYSAVKDKHKDRSLFNYAFENAVVNLAFCYAELKKLGNLNKEKAVQIFIKHSPIRKIEDLKKRGIEKKKKIFR